MPPCLPIIALHGAGMGPLVWEPLQRLMPLTALALPGHGDGQKPLPSIESMGEWAAKQLESPCILMGHSMGALAAICAAKNDNVRALIFLGGAARMPVHPDLLEKARSEPEKAAELVLKWGTAPGHENIRETLRKTLHPDALFSDLSACHAYVHKGIEKPALVISGACDKMVSAPDIEALNGRNTRFRLIQDTGHMIMCEAPEETAAAIKIFMEEISSI